MLCKQDSINFAFNKTFKIRKVFNLSYQALGVYFKPYKTFLSLKTKSGCIRSTNPGGY